MKRRYYLEALASLFIVGLGQVIKGEGDKGLKLILLFYFALPIAVFLALMFNAYLFLVTLAAALLIGLLTWLFNIWDAFSHETGH